MRQYCTACHNDRGKAGGLTLVAFDATRAPQEAVVAEKIIRKLRSGMMPPPGAKRPEEATLRGIAAALETHLDRSAASRPNPGPRPFQRLNRAEYARSIRDLLGLEIDVGGFPSTRHGQRWVRQRRRRAGLVSHVDGRATCELRLASVGWLLATAARRRLKRRTGSRGRRRRCGVSRVRPSARAAASPSRTSSRPMATTASACSWPHRATCCTAVPRAANRSKSRSTATAWRSSTSTHG